MAESQPEHAQVIAFPPAIFAAGFALGLALHMLAPIRARKDAGVRLIGLAAMGAAMGQAAWAARTMRAARTTLSTHQPSSTVVQTGPFRFTRNPLYLSMTAMYVGVTLLLRLLWPLAILPWVLTAVRYGVIGREERYLERVFGEEYRAYRGRVRRWL